MLIGKDKVVSIDYTLKNAMDEIIDSSSGGAPLDYVHGRGMLITGLERELEGHRAGDELSVAVEPADAYGGRRDELVFDIDRERFEDGVAIEEGMRFEADAPGGSRVVTVVKVAGDKITIDANHPLAGEKLFFDVRVVDVRDATEEELSSGCGCGGSCGDGCASGGCAGCGGGCG